MLFLGLPAAAAVFSIVFSISFWFLLTIVLFILSLILLVKNPLLLLFLLIVTRMSLDYPVKYFTFIFFEIPVSLSQILGIGVAILGAINLIIQRRKLLKFEFTIPFLILFLWGSSTLAYSIAPYNTLYELLRFFDFFALGFLAYTSVKKTSDFKKLLVAFFISSLLPIAFALYQLAFGIGFQDDAFLLPRIFGTFSHPNIFSLYLFALAVFACLFFLIFSRSSREQFLSLGLLGIFIAVLFMTFARVAWITLFAFTFLFALFRYRLLLFPVIILPLILFAFSQNFQERALESFSQRPDSSIVWRRNLWYDVTAKSVQDGNLWFGTGMKTFTIVSEKLRGISFGSNDSHNDFVKFFVEGGIIGIIAYLVYIASIFFVLLKNYFHNAKRNDLQLQLAFAMLILFFFTIEIASFSDNVFRNTPVQWLFFTSSGGLLALTKK